MSSQVRRIRTGYSNLACYKGKRSLYLALVRAHLYVMAANSWHPKQHLGIFFVQKVSNDEQRNTSFKTTQHLTPTV
jgi:hypothetical protein